ncbi:DNA-binding domain-containing protein [Thiohalophilus sp.]|uniref:HvfC family RiPP maturation protein n=1 Tax=Thiohalophilus sp. TaxID=3028392 RepID=UPI002ACE2CCC|nr:putative DNA-binding domain-containing protein [Thiohalophilus sp.]MDZ7802926.1 putative DNA-binding domain-containing protein [Thiohalophilus sp.]
MSNRTEMTDFQQQQYRFAAHIRDPQASPAPADVEDRRMAIYRELFYNNVEGFMADSFPVLRQLLNDEKWHRLIRHYFASHRATTPLFPEMPREFLHYLEHERTAEADDPPFMFELAHYEWVELALSLSDQEPDWPRIDTQGDLLKGRPQLSPLAWPLSYHYPVHLIGPDFRPDQPSEQPTWLLVYRDARDEITFMELNPVTARLLQLIDNSEHATGEAMLEQIAAELNHPDPAVVIEGGQQILNDLHQRGVIPGIRLPGHSPAS